jgi:hypothetical protein
MKFQDLYRHYSFGHPDGMKESQNYLKLYEGLITSVEPKLMFQLIHKLSAGCKVRYNDKLHAMEVTFTTPTTIDLINSVIKRADVAGWFWSNTNIVEPGSPLRKPTADLSQEFDSLPPNTKIQLILEAKFSFDVSEYVITNYDCLYHTTLKTKVDKILQKGLSPRTQSKQSNHPERVYFATSVGDLKVYLIPEFAKLTKTSLSNWAILQIDINAIKQPGVRLFNDPAFPGGVYTLSNVAPAFITVAK